MSIAKMPSGTILQSGLRTQEDDYGHEGIHHPVLGIILSVHKSDSEHNSSGLRAHDDRGGQIEATVLVVNDGSDSPWQLSNVVVTPNGCSGYDDYDEELPKGVSGTIDGSILGVDTAHEKLDGDWCIVDFIGGSVNLPFMVTWWPHPSNRRDPTTSGRSPESVSQGRRKVKRFQGTRFAVTSKGSIIVDTNEAGHHLDKGKRKATDTGGDIVLNVKKARKLEVNWNPSVFDPNEPDVLHSTTKRNTRETSSTTVLIDKDAVNLTAGEIVNLKAKADGTGTINHTGNAVNLGGPSATERVPLGDTFKTADDLLSDAMNTFVSAVNTVIASDPVIPPFAKAGFAAACAAFQAVIAAYKAAPILSAVTKTR